MAETLFEKQLKQKILVLDGAMGTMIQQANLTPEDFGGEEYEGCNEYLVLTAPKVIEEIHRAYLLAGSDIIETNTFGGTSLVLDEYDLGHLALEINRVAAQIARKAADELSTLNGLVLSLVLWDQPPKPFLSQEEPPSKP